VSNLSNKNDISSKTTYMNGVGGGIKIEMSEKIEMNFEENDMAFIREFGKKYDKYFAEMKLSLVTEF